MMIMISKMHQKYNNNIKINQSANINNNGNNINMTIAGIVINVPFRMIITIMIMITMMIQSDTANNTNIDNYTSNDVKKYDE